VLAVMRQAEPGPGSTDKGSVFGLRERVSKPLSTSRDMPWIPWSVGGAQTDHAPDWL